MLPAGPAQTVFTPQDGNLPLFWPDYLQAGGEREQKQPLCGVGDVEITAAP